MQFLKKVYSKFLEYDFTWKYQWFKIKRRKNKLNHEIGAEEQTY